MKKFITGLICVWLLSGSMVSAAMSPKRIWQCFSKPKENNCSTGDIAAANAAMISGGIVLTAALAVLGISAAQIKQAKDKNKADAAAQAAAGAERARQAAQISDIDTKIITLKLDQEKNKTKLNNATTNAEKARLRQIIENTKKEIDSLQSAKTLAGHQGTFRRIG